jgi:hypothetical protein
LIEVTEHNPGRIFFGAIPGRNCGIFSYSAGAKVRGAVAGNGGKMAEEKQKPCTRKTKVKTGSTTKSRTRKSAIRKKEANQDGAEQLRQEADKQVGLNSEKLADLLAQKALEGDLASTKMLLGLAENKKPRAKPGKKRRGPSLAEQLTAEPEWQEPAGGEQAL